MRSIDRREIGAFLAIAIALGAIGAGLWLRMPTGESGPLIDATVVSIAPVAEARYPPEPVRAVLSLRLHDGTMITLRRSVDCMTDIRPGDRVKMQGLPNKAGGSTWRIEGEPCPT